MNNSSGKTLSISIAGFAAVLVGLILIWSPREAKSVTAQGFWYGRHLDDSSADIAGIEALTYAPGSELFYAVVAGDEPAGTLTFVALSPQFELVNSWTVSGALMGEPLLAFHNGRLYLVERHNGELYSVAPGENSLRHEGRLNAASAPRAAISGADGLLHVLDGSREGGNDERLLSYAVAAGSARASAGATLTADSVRILVNGEEEIIPSEIRFDNLYLLTGSELTVVVTGDGHARSGQPIRGLQPETNTIAVPAPSQDSTDGPDDLSLYLIDANRLIELSYQAPPQLAPHEVVVPTLVQTTNTGDWEPPSPEPSGMAFMTENERLLISDSKLSDLDLDPSPPGPSSKVNLFLSDQDGNLLETDDTEAFAQDVTGVTLNPANDHFFFVDVKKQKLYEAVYLAGLFVVLNDVDIKSFGSDDPEDVAYDSSSGDIYIVDGKDREVYQIDAGENGQFDEGDTVTSFDVASLGITDPKGLAYDAATDLLVILDSHDGTIIEVTKDGGLVREIDISGVDSEDSAGIMYMPEDSSSTMRTFYVVGRMPADDDDDDDEDDGGDVVSDDDDEDDEDGVLLRFEVAAIEGDPATATPPSTPPSEATATATPGATPTPDVTPLPSPTPGGGPVTDVAYLPMVMALQLHNGLGEPNNSCPQSFPLLVGAPYNFMPEDRDDWYEFTLGADTGVRIRVSNFTPLAGQVAIYRGASCDQATFIQNYGESGTEKTLDIGQQSVGRFFIYISNDGQLTSQSAYSIIVETY